MLQYWFASKEHDRVQKVNAVKALYERLEIKKITTDSMHEFHKKAMTHLQAIEGDKSGLKQFAAMLLQRESR